MVPNKITVHCSASPNGRSVSIEEIRKWHTDPPPKGRGWTDIGYHMVIDVDGSVSNGRSLTTVGAHVEGANESNIGICLVGTDKFSQSQFDALRYKIDSIVMIYSIPIWEIYAHNQFKSAIEQGKLCPGFSSNRLLAWYIGHQQQAIAPHLKGNG